MEIKYIYSLSIQKPGSFRYGFVTNWANQQFNVQNPPHQFAVPAEGVYLPSEIIPPPTGYWKGERGRMQMQTAVKLNVYFELDGAKWWGVGDLEVGNGVSFVMNQPLRMERGHNQKLTLT